MKESEIRAFVNRAGETDFIEVTLTTGQVYRGFCLRIYSDQLQFEEGNYQHRSFRLADIWSLGRATA